MTLFVKNTLIYPRMHSDTTQKIEKDIEREIFLTGSRIRKRKSFHKIVLNASTDISK